MKKCAYFHILIVMLILCILSACGSRLNHSSDEVAAAPTIGQIETAAPTDPTNSMDAAVPETAPPTDMIPAFAPGTFFETYTHAPTDDYLDYYIHIPEDAQLNMPLIVFLHGDTEVNRLDILENFGLIGPAREFYGETFPFITITPCTRYKSWTIFSIPETLKGLIDYIVETYSIDPDRIIITGHSRGAAGVWNMVSIYGGFFAGAVPVSCSTTEMLDYAYCAEVPIWAFVGTVGGLECSYIPKIEYIIKKINDAGGQAEMTLLIDKSHRLTSSAAYTEETFEWMLSQKRSN